MTTWTVAQGRTLTLPVTWLEYEGGPTALVADVTIEIVPATGPPAVVGPTGTGVTSPAVGHNAYIWAVPTGLTPGPYLAIWQGEDTGGDEITATDTITVVEYIPVPGAYATVAELDDWIGSTPTNAAMLLVRASRDVDHTLLCAVYDTTDADVIEALRVATLEQVAAGLDGGDKTGNGAVRKPGFQLGKLAVQAPAVTAAEGGAQKVGRLWSQAWQVLQLAGLTGHGPQTW